MGRGLFTGTDCHNCQVKKEETMSGNMKDPATGGSEREVTKRTANRDQLYAILDRVDALPLLDTRTEDEILGYIED
jgi:hypothetical protein